MEDADNYPVKLYLEDNYFLKHTKPAKGRVKQNEGFDSLEAESYFYATILDGFL